MPSSSIAWTSRQVIGLLLTMNTASASKSQCDLVGEPHEVGLAALRGVPDERTGLRRLDLVHKRFAVGGARRARRPHKLRRHASGQELPSTGPIPLPVTT